ncbi:MULTISPECIES: LuxR family transcriptional regulator [Kribbella]|uniref:helix-turn-helix transcriptional regulator n=1 Tax=Kribbella TaxID=182639 RepID=UPI0013052ADA|nr:MULTISPECIES: LuxR family transcriptional regulator [Kribbella]
MGGAAVTRSLGVAGRIGERGILGSAIRGAVEGRPCAVFVHGEAGVGKTRLVRDVCDEAAAGGVAVLWGRCVRFGAVDSPYSPLISALEGWAESTEPDELTGVLDAVPAAGGLLSSVGGYASDSAVRLLSVVDGLVMAIASRRPTVLVIDDVQWADLASRDALAYLVAGFRRQRLAILTTYRDEELGTGHPMHSWLADLRRLPSVTDVRLDRLTWDETEQQLTMLLGGRPHHHLVDDVVRRSDGNPYLSELLLEGVTITAEQLPADLPAELTGALLAAWHRLSAPAREVMRVLAVAGRPTSIDDLREVAAARGIGPAALTTALAEATDSGISVAQGSDLCWFRHPLLAEVLYATFVPGEAETVHAAWAKTLESRSGTGPDEVQRRADLALHYEGARDLESCLEASLRAAELANGIRAWREEAVHLRRSARLWSTVHRGDTERVDEEVDLLERVARANDLVGDGEAGFAAWSRALELVDERTDPLRASRLVRHLARSAIATNRITRLPIAEARHAVELSQAFPDSEEYAEALAVLSWRLAWNGELELSIRYAEDAVQAAHRSGSTAALSFAYAARGIADVRAERSDRDTAEALRSVRMTSDPDLIWLTLVARQNCLLQRGRVTECVEMEMEFLSFALKAGALSMVAFAAGMLAGYLLMFGRLSESGEVIREGLSLAGLPNASAMVRLTAASLSVRRGDPDAAGLHLQRAKELIPDLEESTGLAAQSFLAEYLLATGRPDQALDLLSRTMAAQSVDIRDADDILVWGARAAGDLVESARDRRDSEGVRIAQTQFDDLARMRQGRLPLPFEVIAPEDLIQPAMEALCTAETARCMAETPTSGVWEEAVRRCDAAGLRWDEALASWRWAEALLAEGATRAVVAVPLRSAHRFAVEAGAIPLRHQVETLAGLGKIRLDEPSAPSHAQPPAPFRSLTKREQEVLSLLVAGRTYAEIAKALFISEKTVSTHVSNLLHKTGTSSRREVAALAIRLGQSPTNVPGHHT